MTFLHFSTLQNIAGQKWMAREIFHFSAEKFLISKTKSRAKKNRGARAFFAARRWKLFSWTAKKRKKVESGAAAGVAWLGWGSYGVAKHISAGLAWLAPSIFVVVFAKYKSVYILGHFFAFSWNFGEQLIFYVFKYFFADHFCLLHHHRLFFLRARRVSKVSQYRFGLIWSVLIYFLKIMIILVCLYLGLSVVNLPVNKVSVN